MTSKRAFLTDVGKALLTTGLNSHMVHYYKKELVSMPFHANGSPVKFEALNGNRGVIALDDANPATKSLIEALDDAANHQRGGIVKLSEAEYVDLKKNLFLTPLSDLKRRSQHVEPLRVFRQPNDPFAKRAVAAPAAIRGTLPPAQQQVAAQPNPKLQHLREKAAQRNMFKPATARVAAKTAETPPAPPSQAQAAGT